MAVTDVSSDFLIVIKPNTQLSYVRSIGAGGESEVYEVLILAFCNANLSLGFRPKDW